MGDKIEFGQSVHDLSNDRGFQFEFSCDRCRVSYRTEFKASLTGAVSGVLDAAGSILGGIFGRAADIGGRVHSAAWESGHRDALREAVAEAQPHFIQCPHCMQWVCRKQCWNEARNLCKECAPDLRVEMAAAQASTAKQEVWAGAASSEEDKQELKPENWRHTISAQCPTCEEPLAGKAKFCPKCGQKLDEMTYCSQCGAKLPAGAKFCTECGSKVEK